MIAGGLLQDPENDWTEVSDLFYKEIAAKPSIMLIWKIYIQHCLGMMGHMYHTLEMTFV
jgi:hypothetical protein